jgi:argininosuccinate synthase
MTDRILLAYSGTLASSAAIAWLAERHGAEVATLTLDLGQADDLDELRARALNCGAARAHVVDVRDTFARDYVIPAVRAAARARSTPGLDSIADPLIARTLVDVRAMEAAGAVAHASRRIALDEQVMAIDPAIRIVAPAREWSMDAAALLDYARGRHLPVGAPRAPHLLIRRCAEPARASDAEAVLAIAFEDGVPVSLNGVGMPLSDLIESLSLIGGEHGIGYAEPMSAPAAAILCAAYATAEADTRLLVRMKLAKGTCTILSSHEPAGELVNHQ